MNWACCYASRCFGEVTLDHFVAAIGGGAVTEVTTVSRNVAALNQC